MQERILAKIIKVKVEEVFALTVPLPLNQNERLVPHLKDSIHICLNPERQECGMIFDCTFKGLNYPQNTL